MDTAPAREPVPPYRNHLRRFLKLAALAVIVLVTLGIVAPFIGVGSYTARIQSSLEAALGRRVTLGPIHYTLFAGPGFAIDDVTIEEDHRYGIEPFAYASTLVARVRLDKLLAGQVEFSSLKLEEPTLNLVKQSDGTWNIVEILERLGREGASSAGVLPAVELSDARLNFKFGTRKSTFYLDGADVTAEPDRDGKLRIRFAASPSRSDRSGHGFATVRGNANWYLRPPNTEAKQLEADVTLDQSNVSEMITLIKGYDIGVHGNVSSRVLLSGPVTHLDVRGTMRLDDIHRWDLIPSSGEEWQVRYHGAIDLLRHQLSFETEAGPGAPITVGLRVNDFLTNPSWSVLAQMRRAPAEKLLPLAQRMGLSLPEGLRLAGNLDGAIGYSAASGWNGGLSLSGIKATLPNSQTLSSDLLTLNITDQRVQILPSIVAADDSAPIEVSGNYDPSTRDVSLRFGLDDAAVRPLSRAITSWFGTPPMLATLEDGRVSGQLQLEQSAGTDMKWRGDFDLKQGRLRAAGVGVPIRDLRARVSVAGSQLTVPRFTAVAGNIPFNGEYRYNSSGLRRERLRLVFSTLDVMALRAALAPAFGPQDFLSRFRIVRRATPSWMANRNLEADAVVTHLLVNGNDLGALQTRCLWTGDTIRINGAQLRMNQGRLDAQGAIDLSSGRPQYELTAAATNVPWNGGAVDISGEVRTSGSGTDALVNLRSSGNFVAYGVTPSDETFSRLSGAFSLAIESGAPKVNLTNVEAERPGEAWVGIGASNPDGTLVLQLVNGERQMRIASPMVSAIVSADTVRP